MKTILSLLAACVVAVSAQEITTFDTPGWKDAYWRNFQVIYESYPRYYNSNRFMAILLKWDAWAKVNRPDVFKDARKCIVYCYWEKQADDAAAAKREREDSIEAAAFARWKAAKDAATVASNQAFKDHVDAMNPTYERSDADQRIDQLEQNERIRQLQEFMRRVGDGK